MMSSPVLTGAVPYRFLDETSVGNGYVRLRALAVLPVMLVVLFAVVLGFENAGYGSFEDRDTRAMVWDYRSTAGQSTSFHGYFRNAYWPSYLALTVNEEVFDEVVVVSEDRVTVLAAFPPSGTCQRSVTVPCLSSKPAHRDETTVGALNLGTDVGIWAVGNGRGFRRGAGGVNVGLLNDGVLSVPNAYADAAALSAVMSTRLAELQEMRTKTAGTVLNAPSTTLGCASDGTGATCVWTQQQWDAWAVLAFTTLATTQCATPVDMCSQTAAALQQAAALSTNVGKVAVRVVTGTWAATNVHLADIVAAGGGLPLVTTVVNAAGAGVLSVPTAASGVFNPMTDTNFGSGTGYVPPLSIQAIVDTAVSSVAAGVPLTGYVRPPDDRTKLHGLRKGVLVHGVRCDLQKQHETSVSWRTRQGYDGTLYDMGIWPWQGSCADTKHNVTVLTDAGVDLVSFPAFASRSAVAQIELAVLGVTKFVPAYESFCDFDSADAGAGGDDVQCAVSILVGIEIRVAATPAAGEVLGGWRLVDAVGVYDTSVAVTTSTTSKLTTSFLGSETNALTAFPAGTNRELFVNLRDAGAPEQFRASPLGTPGKMYLCIGLFVAALVTAPIHPYLMFWHVKFNVALNQGKPPPMWQAMRKFRGW